MGCRAGRDRKAGKCHFANMDGAIINRASFYFVRRLTTSIYQETGGLLGGESKEGVAVPPDGGWGWIIVAGTPQSLPVKSEFFMLN